MGVIAAISDAWLTRNYAGADGLSNALRNPLESEGELAASDTFVVSDVTNLDDPAGPKFELVGSGIAKMPVPFSPGLAWARCPGLV